MEPFRYHAFVCNQEKSDGATCCAGGGSAKVLEALHRELGVAGLSDEVQVSTCGCLGLCESGPVMILYPNGTWYTKLTVEAIPEIVASHLQYDKAVSRLVRNDAAAMVRLRSSIIAISTWRCSRRKPLKLRLRKKRESPPWSPVTDAK